MIRRPRQSTGRSVLPQPLPLTLGSDVAGVIEHLGPGVRHFEPGDAVFGVTNSQFTGGYAEYAAASSDDIEYVRSLGADTIIDARQSKFEEMLSDVDVVLDTVGGDTQERSFAVMKAGGVLVSAVSAPDQPIAARYGVRGLFFLVDVSSPRLEQIAALINAGELLTRVGDVLPLADARVAHEMLAGTPHKRGKIVLTIDQM